MHFMRGGSMHKRVGGDRAGGDTCPASHKTGRNY